MTYAFYNFLWKIIDYFLIDYLNFRVEKAKEIKSRLSLLASSTLILGQTRPSEKTE